MFRMWCGIGWSGVGEGGRSVSGSTLGCRGAIARGFFSVPAVGHAFLLE